MNVDLGSSARSLLQKFDRRMQAPTAPPKTRIAVQKDAAVITNEHRILNFQGAGVTVADDPTMRRTNIVIPGAPTVSNAQIVQSAVGTGKMFPLGSEPSGWQAIGFNDSGWSVTVVDLQARTAPSQWVSATTAAAAAGATFLLRHSFTLATGDPTSAVLLFDVDNIGTVWLNGTQIEFFHNSPDDAGWPFGIQTVTVPIALLVTGTNVLAVKVQNSPTFSPPGPYAVSYQLTINAATAGVDTRYQLLSEKGDASGYADLDSSTLVPTAELGTGSPSGSNFLRGDRTWAPASSNSVNVQEVDGTPTVAAVTIEFPNGSLTDHGSGVVEYIPPSPSTQPYVNVQEQQTSGTNGTGTFTSGAFRTRVLNTIASDSSSIASLSSSQVTLPAGTYICRAKSPYQNGGAHQARLQNITDSTTLLTGTTEYTGGGNNVVTSSFISGRFVLSGTKALEVQSRFGGGGGVPATSFGTEVYTTVEFWKIA